MSAAVETDTKTIRDAIERAVSAERERCAKVAEFLARGQAVEIGGRTLLLGSMTMNPCDAQQATALTIATVIRGGVQPQPPQEK